MQRQTPGTVDEVIQLSDITGLPSTVDAATAIQSSPVYYYYFKDEDYYRVTSGSSSVSIY